MNSELNDNLNDKDIQNITGLDDIISYQKTIGNNISKKEAFKMAVEDLFDQIEWKDTMTDEYFDKVILICEAAILKNQTDNVSTNASYIYENSPDFIDKETLHANSDN